MLWNNIMVYFPIFTLGHENRIIRYNCTYVPLFALGPCAVRHLLSDELEELLCLWGFLNAAAERITNATKAHERVQKGMNSLFVGTVGRLHGSWFHPSPLSQNNTAGANWVSSALRNRVSAVPLSPTSEVLSCSAAWAVSKYRSHQRRVQTRGGMDGSRASGQKHIDSQPPLLLWWKPLFILVYCAVELGAPSVLLISVGL